MLGVDYSNNSLKEIIDSELRLVPLFLLRESLYEAVIAHITRKFAQAALVATPDEKTRLDALYVHLVVGP